MRNLKEHELFTLEDLDAALQGMSEKSKGIYAAMKKASARMKVITGIQNAVADCQTHKAVHDKYLKIGWKARQAAFHNSRKALLPSNRTEIYREYVQLFPNSSYRAFPEVPAPKRPEVLSLIHI